VPQSPSKPTNSDPLSPNEAFVLLGNETRIGILQALWENYDPYAADNTVSFSALYDHVGGGDSGNFNYHLQKLTNHFVRKAADGYKLTASGFEIIQAVIAGAVTESPTLEAATVDATCTRCENPVVIAYKDGSVWAQCSECSGYWQGDGELFGFSLPPEGLRDRGYNEIFDATITYSIHRFETMNNGVCPECAGVVTASLTVCEDHDAGKDICETCGFHYLGTITFVCNSCKFVWRSPSWAPVLCHPVVASFYYDHDIEYVTGSWGAIRRSLEWREELLSTDPVTLRITIPHEEDELHVILNETGTVIDVE
jgi:hypothetical protein